MLLQWSFGKKQRQTTRPQRGRWLSLERLEERELLSATPIVSILPEPAPTAHVGQFATPPLMLVQNAPAPGIATTNTTSVLTVDGTTQTLTLDPSGRTLSNTYTNPTTGQILRSQAYTYDAAGQLLTSTVAAGTAQAATTQFVYAGNNLVTIDDPVGNTTGYGYDAQNRLVSLTDALGHTQTQTYDAAGNVASVTNRDALRREFAYDAQKRELGETWYAPDGVTVTNRVAYTYDAAGRLASAGDDAGTYAFTYDGQGRVSIATGPFGLALTFGYDTNGNRVLVQDSFAGTTASQYDAANELVGRWFAQDGTSLLGIGQQFDNSGNVVQQMRVAGSGTVATTAFGYDTAHDLTGLVHARADGTVIAAYAYAYDAASAAALQSASASTHAYTYDAAGQLIADNGRANAFDPNGNRTTAGFFTGVDNRLLSDGTWNYTYDNDGNTTGKTNIATGATWTYGYDAKDRMVSAVQRDATGVLLSQSQYAYDVYDHRIVSVTTDATGIATETHFAYDGDHLFALLDAGNHLVERYVSLDAPDSAFVRIGADGGVARTAAWRGCWRTGSAPSATSWTTPGR